MKKSLDCLPEREWLTFGHLSIKYSIAESLIVGTVLCCHGYGCRWKCAVCQGPASTFR